MKRKLYYILIILGMAAVLIGILSFGRNPVAAVIALVVGIAVILYCIKHKPEEEQKEALAKPVVESPKKEEDIKVKKKIDSISNTRKNVSQRQKVQRHAVKTFHVTETSYRTDAIESLAIENPDYEMTKKEIVDSGLEEDYIWEYNFFPKKVEIIPEPDNPYDSNALKVVIDGEHVGYIKKGACSQVKNLLKSEKFMGLNAFIGGGRYKYVWEDEDEPGKFNLEKGKNDYSIKIDIMLKSE